MIYSTTIKTLDAGETPTRKTTVLQVTRGLVYKVEVSFPPGSAGLLSCTIFDGGFQVWPSNLGQAFSGDDIVIGFDDTFLKNAEPFEFKIETCNADTEYSHGVTVRIGLVSKEIFMARFLPSMTYKYFEEMMLKLQAAQAAAAAEQEVEREQTPYEILYGT